MNGTEKIIFLQESNQDKIIYNIAVVDTKFLDIEAFKNFNINIRDDPPKLHADSSKDHQALNEQESQVVSSEPEDSSSERELKIDEIPNHKQVLDSNTALSQRKLSDKFSNKKASFSEEEHHKNHSSKAESSSNKNNNEDTDSEHSSDVENEDSTITFVPFPKGLCEKNYKSTFTDNQIREIQKFVQFRAKLRSLIEEDAAINCYYYCRALKNFVAEGTDRPELCKLSKEATLKIDSDNDQALTYNFQVQYYTATMFNDEEDDIGRNLIKTLFQVSEHKTIDNVFEDKNTQSLSVVYYYKRNNGEVMCGCISTIIFRLVNVAAETEPFIFVYYRGTNSTPLSERLKHDSYYSKYKYEMENLGLGHFLLRLAQQLLCEFDDKRRSFRMYLVANNKLIDDHYSKIGFKKIDINARKQLNTANIPEELKECLELENTRNTSLKLVVCEGPIPKDKICFRRMLSKRAKYQAKHVGARLIELQEDQTAKAIEEVLKEQLDDISDEDENALVEEYPRRFVENTDVNKNPFILLNNLIAHKAKLQFRKVVDRYIKDLGLDNSDDEEAEMDDSPKLFLSHAESFLLKCFELEIEFDGSFNNSNTILNCKKGNIFCKNCGKQILAKNVFVDSLIKNGANMIHYHITTNMNSLGITSESSWDHFYIIDGRDKEKLVLTCNPLDNTSLYKNLFENITKDAAYEEEDLNKASTNMIMFLQCVFKMYYGGSSPLFKKYLRRSAQPYTKCIERIKNHFKLTFKNQRKKMTPYLETIIREYTMLSSNRYQSRNYAERQRDLVTSITTNPKQHKTTNSNYYYRGRDMSHVRHSKQRTEHREFYLAMDLKQNWQTVELVNTKTRDTKKRPLNELSEKIKEKEPIHWLGKADDNGKPKYFLVSQDLIPDNYKTEEGPIFKPKFFYKLGYNVEKPIPQTIRDKFKLAYDEYRKSNIEYIMPYVNSKTKKKTYWGKTVGGKIVKNYIDEKWLKENFFKYYKEFYFKVTKRAASNEWCAVPVGSRENAPEDLPKVEDKTYISIYLPNSFKCAFANLANALHAVSDFEAARFIESHFDSDNTTLLSLVDHASNKTETNHFILAPKMLQKQFGYQIKKITIYDNLLKPVPDGQIKYVTLMPQPNGYKHVIAIAGSKIYDCENMKVLTLCKENIAWCSAKTMEDIDRNKQTIIDGCILKVPKRRAKHVLKRKFDREETTTKNHNYESKNKRTKYNLKEG